MSGDRTSPIITLTTDFGLRDPYVASVKGVILTLDPAARIVDVSHEIEPQGIIQAGYTLACAFEAFPAGTIHLLVVDPGVGTSRRLLVARAADHLFLAPDNGALGLILEESPPAELFHLTAEHYFRAPSSPTFHGRDRLAPAAAWLSRGIPPARFGEPLSDWVPFPLPGPEIGPGARATLRVLAIDRFGNIVLNLKRERFEELRKRSGKHGLSLVTGKATIGRLFQTYADCPDDEPFALFNSYGYLEIALRNGTAASRLECRTHQTVELCMDS